MILDATCAYRRMWINKPDDTVFLDERKEVKPQIQARWQHLPFADSIFDMVVFDPPYYSCQWIPSHDAIYKNKDFYGFLLPDSFHIDLYQAFKEFFRVLKKGGFLILKWNDKQYSLNKVLSLALEKPLFGQRTWASKNGQQTFWVCFQKRNP